LLNKSKKVCLNEIYFQEPKIEEKEKFYCCCCCKSGPMTMILYVPYIGFVPGQSIPITIELDNNSNVEIDSIKIELERVIFLDIILCNILIYVKNMPYFRY